MDFIKDLLNNLPNSVFSWRFLLKALLYIVLILIGLAFSLWVYLSTEKIPNLISLEEAQKYTYDYIIVGGGTAGCVLASRLSQNAAVSVLLIEAGSTFSPLAMVPFLTSQQQKTSNDWKLVTVSQKHSSYGFLDQIQYLPRGRGLGGSSQLNYMLHFDGIKKDLRRWETYGAELWDFEDVEETPYEKYSDGECEKHSCKITDQKQSDINRRSVLKTVLRTTPITYDYSLLSSTFVDGSTELSRKNSSNLDFHLVKYNTERGFRHSSYHTYLKPAFGRENLNIVLGTRVHRVLFKSKHAIGVLASEEGRSLQKIFATKEVILAAGAFHTPHILKLSGVGPAKELKQFDIGVVQNSPMIGRNLYDHMSMPIYVSVSESMTVTRNKVLNVWEILNYLIHGKGIFSNFGVIGYLNDRDNDHGTGIFGVGTIDESLLQKIVNYDKDVFRANFPFYHDGQQEGFVLLNTCYQPVSRGTVRLSSNRINDMPTIDPNYLKDQADIDCLIRSIRLSIDLIATNAFKAVNATIHWPQFSQCKNFLSSDGEMNITDQYLECIIRVGAVTAHHPGGSCAIGNAPNSALDNKMRVRGVRKLRVVDASILPTPVSGTPHTAVVAIAEWASQIIAYGTS